MVQFDPEGHPTLAIAPWAGGVVEPCLGAVVDRSSGPPRSVSYRASLQQGRPSTQGNLRGLVVAAWRCRTLVPARSGPRADCKLYKCLVELGLGRGRALIGRGTTGPSLDGFAEVGRLCSIWSPRRHLGTPSPRSRAGGRRTPGSDAGAHGAVGGRGGRGGYSAGGAIQIASSASSNRESIEHVPSYRSESPA